jgi:hypothetical protein
VGIKDSTSALLPPACDEFLFYDTLEGVEVPVGGGRRRRGRSSAKETPKDEATRPVSEQAEAEADPSDAAVKKAGNVDELAILIAQTLAGLQRSSDGAVLASSIKRALLRKDPTFSEAEYGFRAFGELLRHLADRNVVELSEGSAKGDPEVSLPSHGGEKEAFELLGSVVWDLQARGDAPHLSGLKNQVRKVQPDFSEKKYGYRGFLQFCKAAETQGLVSLEWDEDAEDYVIAATPR